MIRSIFVSAALLLGSASLLAAEDFDAEADAAILALVNSTEFVQDVVDYPYGDEIYPITILHNPQKKRLWTEGFLITEGWELALVANLPFELIAHLKDLVPEIRKESETLYIDLRGYEEIDADDLLELKPIRIAYTIQDPETDQQVQEIFGSNSFVNKVFHYRLEGKHYKVRVMHNPEKRTFSSTREYWLDYSDTPVPYTLSWSCKYAIMMDRQAPQELIDHLSKFTRASWWDWYYNFQVANGTYVSFLKVGAFVDTRYLLDPWFYFAADLLD